MGRPQFSRTAGVLLFQPEHHNHNYFHKNAFLERTHKGRHKKQDIKKFISQFIYFLFLLKSALVVLS